MIIHKNKMLDYIVSNFNIDMVAYSLISEIIERFSRMENGINTIIKILNNSGIDITKKELKENDIIYLRRR